MNLGIIAALVGVISAGIATTAMKYIANRYENNYSGLIWQYISMSMFAFLYVFVISKIVGWQVFPVLDLTAWIVLAVVGVIGFVGIALLFEAMDHLSAGICLIIANLSVFLMYFANIWLFDGNESLPLVQIILGIVFFVIVAQFLWAQSSNSAHSHKHRINHKALLPLGTALCWTVFFVGNTWFVKTETMTPVQTVFASELAVFAAALLWYMLRFKFDFSDVRQSFRKCDIIPLLLIGFCNVGANFLFYYGYTNNPANIINFIRLFLVIMTAVFSWIFLKDRLTRHQIALMSAAFIVLVVFVFIERILLYI